MPIKLPAPLRHNAPWTPLQRRTWLAEQRRKEHLLPAPVIRPKYPDLIVWDWDLLNPYKWNFWMSMNGGATYILIEDYWMYGDARQFAPDGGGELYYAVGVDKDGNEITQHSNIVRPDDAPVPLDAPTLVRVNGYYQGTAPVAASVWRFAQADGYDGSMSIQDWADSADLADASYGLLPPNQAQSVQGFSNCSCRYQVAGVWSPWCAVI